MVLVVPQEIQVLLEIQVMLEHPETLVLPELELSILPVLETQE